MKKMLLSMFAVALLVLPASYVQAADPAEALQKKQGLIDAKKAELDAREWKVTLKPASGDGKQFEDTLLFQKGRFESKKLGSEGYSPTNYTLTVEEGAPVVFETMQSGEDGKVVFWRGEWEGEKVKGLMSKQKDGKSEDFYFWSTELKKIEPVVEEPVGETKPSVQPAEEPVSLESVGVNDDAPAPAAQKETKKKKKRRFGL